LSREGGFSQKASPQRTADNNRAKNQPAPLKAGTT